MRTRISILVVVSMLVLVSLSCNLPAGSQAVKEKEPGQQASGDTSQPAATQVLAATNPPKAKATSEPAAPAQKPANPSDFKGGITALEGYPQALSKAQAWSPNAVLETIAPAMINQGGKSETWVYTFADDTLKTAADRNQGFYAVVTEAGVKESRPSEINFTAEIYLQANPADWKVDSGQALTACAGVGAGWLSKANPDMHITADLIAYDTPPTEAQPARSAKNIIWNIIYFLPSGSSVTYCQVDGNTGQVVTFGIQPSEFPKDKKISSLSGFQTALSKAREWNPKATLFSVRLDCYDEKEPSMAEGLAKCWNYTFIVLPEPDKGDYQPAYQVIVGAIGIVGFRASSAYAGHVANGLQEDWTIDSQEVYRIAEENGGKAFREQYPTAVFSANLEFAWDPVNTLNTAKNIRWDAGYSIKGDYDHSLTFVIDAATGKVVSHRP